MFNNSVNNNHNYVTLLFIIHIMLKVEINGSSDVDRFADVVVGVLAVQGSFVEHIKSLHQLPG